MLKKQVLQDLEKSRNCPISGQVLAERYQVSRNAVWKAMNVLKQEGYEILSVKNKGYILAPDCDRLSREGILARLGSQLKDMEIYSFQELDSTNNEARRMLASGFRGRALLVSECQSAGRGRGNHLFYSPAQTGLYLSILPAAPKLPVPPTLITIAAAVAVSRAVENVCGLQLQVKWVNDLYLNGKKVGGILSEAVTDLESGKIEEVVVGVGLNITTTVFPVEIEKKAGSLGAETGNRNNLAAEIARCFFQIDLIDVDSYMEEYRQRSMVLGTRVQYEGQWVFAEGLDEVGGLIVCYENGEKKILRSGNIHIEEN